MQDQFILTPFFLDQPLVGLDDLADSSWVINRPALPSGEPQMRMGVLHEGLAAEAARALAKNLRPVSIAGDCCTAIGMAAGIQRAGIAADLVWFDAHGDFNTWETTPSGFLGGMPLAMIAGLGEQTMPENVSLLSWPQNQIVLTDGRDLDPGEVLLIQSSEIRHLPDPADLLDNTVPDRLLYVHFDTDIVNPQDAPAMNYLAHGGPRARNLEAIFNFLARSRHVVAVSMSSWAPVLDQDGRSRAICMKLLKALLV